MHVVVDFEACQCHALCTVSAPEVFEIDDDGLLQLLIERPGEELREKVERGVRECPTQAISIEES
jgi:ferredoxin